MNKKWILGALIAVSDKLDFPPEKKPGKDFEPLLTPKDYAIIKRKYGNKTAPPNEVIEEEIKNYFQNILIKTGYVCFENESLKRELEESYKKIKLCEQLLRRKDSKIKSLNDRLGDLNPNKKI